MFSFLHLKPLCLFSLLEKDEAAQLKQRAASAVLTEHMLSLNMLFE